MRRFFAVLILAGAVPLSAGFPLERLNEPETDMPDCLWEPFPLFTNAYVQAPDASDNEERLYLRKEPSYAEILPGTEPFNWVNHMCNLWPGMRLRVAEWGGRKDRFAKIYYDGHVFWVSKTYRDGSDALMPVSTARVQP
jgi:hypothetical protein